jgi:hypothetical protein
MLMTNVAYAPQLGAKLGISHTQLNIVALAGNGAIYRTSVERWIPNLTSLEWVFTAPVRYGDELWTLGDPEFCWLGPFSSS